MINHDDELKAFDIKKTEKSTSIKSKYDEEIKSVEIDPPLV
jgi:hypothetical protein